MTINDIDALIAAKDTTTRAGQLARNSFLVLRERWEPSTPPLRIEFGRGWTPTTLELSEISRALQDATAKVALLLLHQNQDKTRLSAEIRERAQLVPRGQSHNHIFFGFPDPVVAVGDQTLPLGHVEHLSERAVRELMQVLPESPDDRAALDQLPGRRLALRAAVSTLAKVVQGSGDLTIELASRTGTPEVSILTETQAREVPMLLSRQHEEIEQVVVEGVLDGMRTRRRLIYVIEPDDRGGLEYVGSIEPGQVDDVQKAVGQFVRARLTKTTRVRDDGSRSHATYALVSFDVPQALV